MAVLTLPPVPGPRESPATRSTVVPVRTLGDHWKPVTLPGKGVAIEVSILDDWPPGMTRRMVTFLWSV